MKKSLVLFLVATLLLAGCTELLDSEDGETMKIEINEDIAFEKINDFMTVDEGESFGITMMYEMDSSMLAESGLVDADEDSDAVLTMEMTEAWSPAGYHTSSIMGMSSEGVAYKMVETMTHIGTTMYVTIGYDATGSLPSDATDDEKMQFEMIAQQGLESYSMTTSNSHTEVIASMAEETQDNGDDMDMMEMLEVFTFTECMGEFTPSNETVDGLQIFDVTMVDMEDSMTPDMALCLFDTDDSDSISFEEFTASDDTEEDDVDEMRTVFDDADADADGELNSAELVTFIEAVDSHDDEEDHMHGDEDEHMHDEDESGEMPDMSVAFNDAGEIEYFGMSMDGTDIQMYVLTEDKVSAFFSGAEAGELVALPFVISSDMGDDYDSGDDDYYEETFRCDDGETIPMDYVNDGEEDCDGGEDEDTTDGSDNGGDNGEDQNSEDDGPPSPQSLLDMTDTDQNGLMDFDEFITFLSEGDGEESAEYMTQSVIDEFNEIFNSSDLDESDDLDLDELEQFLLDLDEYMSTSDDGHDEMWTFNREMSECDSDADGMVDFDELDACVTMDIANDGYGDEGVAEQSLRWMFDLVDADEDGMLDSDEFEDFAEMTSEEPMMVCYDRYADEIDSSVTSYEDCEAGDNNWIQALQPVNDGGSDSEDEFRCDDGSTIPMSYVNDGDEDCAGGEDEDDMGGSDDHDHGDSDDSDEERVWYITNEMDFHFEGDMNDYSIVLETCEEDMDMETGEMTKDCSTYMTISMNDAMLEGSSVMFHDTDSSGTISDGDMIHVSESDNDWNEVRLYSSSADAYSDENPMHNTPGFTGIVGMLALLGAAFIRRNE
tara:strand:+ start:2207 stop:4696 length:2490 start_codon:yes stop_codon:yes gene_type:complete